MSYLNTILSGTGRYIPTRVVTNEDFAKNVFFNEEGTAYGQPHEEIAEKFKAITGIEERRYVTDDQTSSNIGAIAARLA